MNKGLLWTSEWDGRLERRVGRAWKSLEISW